MQRLLDSCRWVYNKTLEARRDAWQERGESLSRYETNKLLTIRRDAFGNWYACFSCQRLPAKAGSFALPLPTSRARAVWLVYRTNGAESPSLQV